MPFGDDVFVRFWTKVRAGRGGCQEWTGTWCRKNPTGEKYGLFKIKGKYRRAHRWIYEQLVGPIRAGLILRHKCDNGLCVNVDHLETGTHGDNARDREARGRSRWQRAAQHLASLVV